VNPTWMDVNDVLGRVNLLDRSYNPSESGVYRHLILAEQEYRNLELESGFWPIVLDEMNLAQVEYYFGAFMQKFGVKEERTLRIFDAAVVRHDDPFASWSILSLSSIFRMNTRPWRPLPPGKP
jgi:5-methylcytosine-specific restriction endonuclease McrBC GTP-binding regulatory subunit McrB